MELSNLISRDTLKEVLVEVLLESARSSKPTLRVVRNTPEEREADLPTKGAKETMKKLEQALKLLSSQNPDLEGKTRVWGVSPTTRKAAIVQGEKLVADALASFKRFVETEVKPKHN